MKTENQYEETLDTLTMTVNGKFILLPQYIYSANKKFNELIQLEMSLDDFYPYGDLFSQNTEKVIKIMRSYFSLMDECEDAGTNLMTMLFQIFHETGKLKNEYYSVLNKLLATNNYAASYYVALDLITSSDKSEMNDFLVKRGYNLMLTLEENGHAFAKLFSDTELKNTLSKDEKEDEKMILDRNLW